MKANSVLARIAVFGEASAMSVAEIIEQIKAVESALQ